MMRESTSIGSDSERHLRVNTPTSSAVFSLSWQAQTFGAIFAGNSIFIYIIQKISPVSQEASRRYLGSLILCLLKGYLS